MSDRLLHLLSPYRPPTSYPVSLSTDEASAWLNGYAALWHPSALRGALLPPTPASAYDHNDPQPGAVYALARGPSLFLPDDWRSRAGSVGAIVFEATPDRAATFAEILAALPQSSQVEPATLRLFTGLGFGYLMLDTLFDASNHDRLLDLEKFWIEVQAAVEAVVSGADPREPIVAAANRMKTAREGLAPNGATLVDLIACSAADMAEPWPCPFSAGHPLTLISDCNTLENLAAEHPAKFAALSEAAAEAVDLAVGVMSERDDTLLPVESQIWSLRQARRGVQKLLGRPPQLFGRLRSEFHPQLPSWLSAAGTTGMVALNLDQATLPTWYSSVIQWPGPDGRSVNAFTRDPHPAHEPATFFNFAHHLHDATSRETVPLFSILHTTKASAAYDDLLAVSELASVFGDWTGVARLLADNHSAEYVAVPGADEFFIDTLDDRVTKRQLVDPVSSFARHARGRRTLDSAFALTALHRTLVPPTADDLAFDSRLLAAETALESQGHFDALAELETAAAAKLAERLLARSTPGSAGWLVLNPSGSVRRVGLELDAPAAIPLDGAVKASEFEDGRAKVVVEVPGLGFAWIPQGVPGTVLPKPRLRTAEGTTVRNEFLEAELDPATGAIKAIRDGRLRVTRLGQILAWHPGSRMVASSVRVTHAGAALGEVTSRGEILDIEGKLVAQFTQRVRAWVGRPALEISISLRPAEPVRGYPWHNFFGCRFAWRDDRSALYRGVQTASCPTNAARPQSPDFFEIRLGKERTSIMTGGLPFLQKQGGRMVDVVLATEGETATNFELMVAFDRDYPLPTAQTWLAPLPVLSVDRGPPPTGASGWLANFDLPSLMMTSLRPVAASDGKSRAIELRLAETAGFAASTALRFARDPHRAATVDLIGERIQPVEILDGVVPLDCSANEIFSVRAEWE